jgi:hypothetical protein
LYPALPQLPIGSTPADLATSDYVLTYNDPLTGSLPGTERDPDAVTPKAELDATVTLATVEAKQFAVVLDGVPSKLFDSQASLRSLLGTEMARRLDEAVDARVVSAIEATAPPSSSVGADLVAKVRFALAAAHDLGSEPSVIALTPSDAASLDLTQDDGGYTFRVDAPRVEGAGSVVWSLRVREVPSVSDPLLVDPTRLGVLYSGGGSVLVDPYSSLQTNQVRVRVELEAEPHVRDLLGAFVIA